MPTYDNAQPPRDSFQYETLSYGGRLDILDREGRLARFTRRQRIRFLEDGVGTFFDRVWGDGVLFAGYTTPGMRILDAIPTRNGYVVPLALPRPFRKGDTFEITTQRRIVGAFTDDLAYWDSAMHAPTEYLAIDVVSPHGRHFRAPDIVAPPRGDMDAKVHDRRLSLRLRRPALYTPYKLTWAWK